MLTSNITTQNIIRSKKALLLDMNNTFMFGEDRFSKSEDYSIYYESIGGCLPQSVINEIIRNIYDYLGDLYPKENYRNNFPSIADALNETLTFDVSDSEIDKIVRTFSHHEHGYIPKEYIDTLHSLNKRYLLSAVIDIWAPKSLWLDTFKQHGIDKILSTASFSSDHGIVKPSPKPFEMVVNQLGVSKESCLVIGDSKRRDLGGAIAAGIDCVLVGGAQDHRALACYANLLEFSEIANNSYISALLRPYEKS
jgi:FMN phosphatase YigB (HAD superfamily)